MVRAALKEGIARDSLHKQCFETKFTHLHTYPNCKHTRKPREAQSPGRIAPVGLGPRCTPGQQHTVAERDQRGA